MRGRRSKQGRANRSRRPKRLDRRPTDEPEALKAAEEDAIDGLLRMLHAAPGSARENLRRVLSGIAAEGYALARLIQAEADKARLVAASVRGPFAPEEVIDHQKALAHVLSEVVKYEEILLRKLRFVLAFTYDTEEGPECEDDLKEEPFDFDGSPFP